MAEGLPAKVDVLGQKADTGFVAVLGAVALAGAYYYRESIRNAIDGAWKWATGAGGGGGQQQMPILALRDTKAEVVYAPDGVTPTGIKGSGLVVDQQIGAPVPGAFIWAKAGTQPEAGIATSALDGKFSGSFPLAGPPSPLEAQAILPSLMLQARKAGYQDSVWFAVGSTNGHSNGHSLTVNGMTDGATGDQTYTVNGSNGEPIGGAEVTAMQGGSVIMKATSDAVGKVVLLLGSPGAYDITARTNGHSSKPLNVRLRESTNVPSSRAQSRAVSGPYKMPFAGDRVSLYG